MWSNAILVNRKIQSRWTWLHDSSRLPLESWLKAKRERKPELRSPMWIAGLCLVWTQGFILSRCAAQPPFLLLSASWIDTSKKRVIAPMGIYCSKGGCSCSSPPCLGLAEPTQDPGFPTEGSVPCLDYDWELWVFCGVVADFSCCGWGQTSACRERICQGQAMSPLLPPHSHRTGTRESNPVRGSGTWSVSYLVGLVPAGVIKLLFLLEAERPDKSSSPDFTLKVLGWHTGIFTPLFSDFTIRMLNCWLCLKFLLPLEAYVSDFLSYDDVVCTLTQELFS